MLDYRKSNSADSKFKKSWSRKLLIWGFIFTLGAINFSCKEDCDCKPENEVNVNDEYYVKYEVNSSTIYTGGKLDVKIKTENNSNKTIIVNQKALWETIIGPVSKGFTATMDVNAADNTFDKLKLYTNIYVSKNGSPFALKINDGSDTPRDAVQINYTIDY